ncbi:histone-lysine N-methyltransferase PRDM9-like isoform X2 [Spodoptera litura]|uniref:Histone-lysine N-methyltransferase PRDM9-like isoform X2 n=1 Tax=Spodoptera litura TaxID=69820 RepID=A0A9J7DUD4_SPOLT|nr:histone-lysine N-methyltransferase PRDM9-like isoform X2 [Spodoptera litura]
MLDPIDTIDMKSCRICLTNNKPLCPLFRYKLSGNYAEMLTAIADVKVSSNDGLPEKICLKCCTTLEKAYLLKTVAERSDKKLRKILAREKGNVPTKKIAFDSFTDIKSEIGPLTIKSEPKWEMEIEVPESNKPIETMEGKDIVIANTVIRKVDPNAEDIKLDTTDDVQLTWTSSGNSDYSAKGDPDAEYLEDDFFQDDDDDDYVPPVEKPKNKFKKPKLSDIKVFKGKTVVRKVKVLKKIKDDPEYDSGRSRDENKSRSTTITCYPILKNGSRGSPILLKRPKDATILKVHAGYKSKSQSTSSESVKVVRREKPVRMVRTSVSKQREKLVCPVCGILTFTLGNHMATHQEKKRYTCAQCPRSFAQKSNLLIHAKQHTGIKDHICEVCGAGFYSQKSLVRHNLIHKGERPFSCNLCTKRFIAMAGLRRHMAIHTGEKRYNCNYCNKKFTQSHHLQNHMITHTGERPYTCEVCNVAFSYKVNLNNHVYKVHGINLKFKSIHTVTEDILRREMGMMNETRVAITHILPQLGEVPTPAAHETVLSLT